MDRMKNHLGSAFIKTVGMGDGRQKTAAELGGRLADLGKMTEWPRWLVADDGGRVITVSSEPGEQRGGRGLNFGVGAVLARVPVPLARQEGRV